MKFTVDPLAKSAYIDLSEGTRKRIVLTRELKTQVLIDFYYDGTVVGIEIIDYPTDPRDDDE